ncbi:MAG: SPOR domain-containing protein [Parahaliea sp.]
MSNDPRDGDNNSFAFSRKGSLSGHSTTGQHEHEAAEQRSDMEYDTDQEADDDVPGAVGTPNMLEEMLTQDDDGQNGILGNREETDPEGDDIDASVLAGISAIAVTDQPDEKSEYLPDDFDPNDDNEDEDREDTSHHSGDASENDPEDEAIEDDGEPDSDDEADDYNDDWDEDDGDDLPWWQNLPMGMMLVVVVALILLSIGGLGVLQERSELRREITELRSRLAVSVSPEQLATERDVRRSLSERANQLSQQLEEMQQENTRLRNIIDVLEQQGLSAAGTVSTTTTDSATASTSTAVPPSTQPPVTEETVAATTSSGRWFVNFGSYSRRTLAEHWAKRLKPAAGKVVVNAIPGSDLYRVRIVALPNRSTADSVAKHLQEQYNLPRLWVGED